MSTMPIAAPRWSSLLRTFGAGLIAALATALAPATAQADTGDTPPAPADPSSAGYTGDVDPGSQSPVTPPAQPTADELADHDPSALTDFRDTLDPHGTWVQDPTYGTVWVPNSAEVGADFAPYQTSGHWVVADSGDWMWASDYDWGYVPFHYGRWVWAGAYWAWIPGRVYAPAWVTWRVGDGGYIGWAPLPPTWYWADGVAVGLWAAPWAAYCFVPTSAVFYNHVSTYVVRDRGVVQRAASTTRPYHPATPSVGHRGGPTARHKAPSPSFQAAGIPASSIPRQRTAHDARAIALSARQPARGGLRGAPVSNAQATRGSAWHNSYDGFGRSVRAPSRDGGYSRGHTLSHPSGVHTGAPSAYRSGHAGGGFHPVAPAHRAAPSSYPSHVAPSFHTSAPAARATPTLSRPSSVSRPSSRSSGGARSSGGRRR